MNCSDYNIERCTECRQNSRFCFIKRWRKVFRQATVDSLIKNSIRYYVGAPYFRSQAQYIRIAIKETHPDYVEYADKLLILL